ncbi:hypothetical protein Tco_0419396 [Tanacetum coccineum]
MIQFPVLALPNFNEEFVIKTDALGFGIEYKKGADNAVANILSRIERQGVLISFLTGTSNELMDVVIATWSTDLSLQAVI